MIGVRLASRRVIWRQFQRLALAGAAVALLCVLAICGTVAWVWRAHPLPLAKLDAWPSNPVVTDRSGSTLLQIVGSDDQWRQPIGLAQMSPWLPQATLAAEDERFYSHAGVDPISVCRAVLQNVSAGGVRSGASTISMQVCRMIDDRPRTWRAKIVEACRALQLERSRSKSQILESYLNIAPYGGNLRGVQAAARAYFQKDAAELSLGEAALLAGLPKSPTRLRPDLQPAAARRRRAFVLHRMRTLGLITEQQRQLAASEPIRAERRPFLHAAPHAAWLALSRCPDGGRTTIDLRVQREAEQALARHAAHFPPASDAAIVVIDIPTGDVVALVGSADPAEPARGQVNGAISLRSPGSALKPFLFAAAFEARRLAPNSLVYDGPLDRADWSPENFDRTYAGELSAAEALRRSLNVPAILTAEGMGLPRCLGLMEAAGIDLPADAQRRGGLAVAVGAVEVRLLDLTNAYATLGRGGVRRAARLLVDEPSPAVRVISSDVCAALDEILSSRQRAPEGLLATDGTRLPWFMWKTGTSSGRRDAWAVGHNRKYAVGVWVGRFSGAGHAEFVGKNIAEPLLAELFAAPLLRQEVDPPPPPHWPVEHPLAFPISPESRVVAPLQIVSPARGDVFVRPGEQAVVRLKLNRPSPGRWFLNGLLLEETPPERLELTAGSYELRCVETSGAVAAVTFRVE